MNIPGDEQTLIPGAYTAELHYTKRRKVHCHPEISLAHPDVARLLLERGAEVNVLDEYNMTPLHLAEENRMVGAVHVLLEHGANVGADDKEGRTPLYAAVEGRGLEHESSENEDAEVRTRAARAWRECRCGGHCKEGRTLLHAAMEGEAVKVVSVLLEHGANVDAEDNKGRTPFQIALAER